MRIHVWHMIFLEIFYIVFINNDFKIFFIIFIIHRLDMVSKNEGGFISLQNSLNQYAICL